MKQGGQPLKHIWLDNGAALSFCVLCHRLIIQQKAPPFLNLKILHAKLCCPVWERLKFFGLFLYIWKKNEKIWINIRRTVRVWLKSFLSVVEYSQKISESQNIIYAIWLVDQSRHFHWNENISKKMKNTIDKFVSSRYYWNINEKKWNNME